MVWAEVVACEVGSSSTPETEIPICNVSVFQTTSTFAYFVLQVIEEVRPGLFNTSFLFDNGFLDDTRQDTESHGDTMVVVAVNGGATSKRFVILAKDDDTVVKFVGLNAEFS